MPTFKHPITVRLGDTDAAGRIYFAQQFRLAHDAFEDLMDRAGVSLRDAIRGDEVWLPIVHAEGDYMGALGVGDRLEIEIWIEKFGETSLTWAFRLIDDQAKDVGKGRIVHVCLNPKDPKKPMALPDRLKNALKNYLKS